MTPEPAAPAPRRRWHIGRWLALALLAYCAYGTWRVYDLRAAVKEAKALGWLWTYDDPFDAIRADWKAAFRGATWTEGKRDLTIPKWEEHERHTRLLHRLAPRSLAVKDASELRNLSAFEGLSTLRILQLFSCNGPVNVDALKGLLGLQQLALPSCTTLMNVDALKGLSGLRDIYLLECTGLVNVDGLSGHLELQKLRLDRCTGLTNVNGLSGLSGLKRLFLSECTGLTNVDALKGLKGLEHLDIGGCTGLSVESIASLRAALPNTVIFADK